MSTRSNKKSKDEFERHDSDRMLEDCFEIALAQHGIISKYPLPFFRYKGKKTDGIVAASTRGHRADIYLDFSNEVFFSIKKVVITVLKGTTLTEPLEVIFSGFMPKRHSLYALLYYSGGDRNSKVYQILGTFYSWELASTVHHHLPRYPVVTAGDLNFSMTYTFEDMCGIEKIVLWYGFGGGTTGYYKAEVTEYGKTRSFSGDWLLCNWSETEN